MRLGIKGKQVLGVTSIVGAVVVVLSLMHLARLARVSLDESRARAELLANAIFHRAREVVASTARSATRRCAAIPACGRFSSRACTPKNVTFAAIVDAHGLAVAHADPALEGQPLPAAATSTRCCRAVAVYAAARDLSRPGAEPRVPAAAAARRRRVRIDPDRRVDAADPAAI